MNARRVAVSRDASPQPTSSHRDESPQIRVLLIEDSLRSILREILSRGGFEGVSSGVVRRWERGAGVTAARLDRIAPVGGVTPEWLLGDATAGASRTCGYRSGHAQPADGCRRTCGAEADVSDGQSVADR